MPSLRSKLLIFLLKHRHLLRFQARRPSVDLDTSISDLRTHSERSASRLGGSAQGVRIEPIRIGTVPAEWLTTDQTADQRTILYFHGGGYVMGSLTSHRAVVAKFAKASRIRCLHFQYRLAPEAPFPAAINDSVSAYMWLLAQGVRPEQIVFLGDSAGGGLCLATLLALKARNLPLPAGACAMSPWTDLTCSGESYSRRDDLAPDGSWRVFASYYAGQHPTDHPFMSPLFGDLSGLPPLLLCVGDAEAMADDSIRFAMKAVAQGVDAQLLLGKGMVHCYPVFSPFFPEAKQAFDQICRFLRRHLEAAP